MAGEIPFLKEVHVMRHLNRLRIEAGYSISDLARITGVDDVTACRWLCGNARPDRQQQEHLAAVLGVTIRALDEPEPEQMSTRKIDRLRDRLLAAASRPS